MIGNTCAHSFVCTIRSVLLVALALISATAFAQTPWKPQRPVELIVGSAAGNSNDLMLRLIAQVTQEKRLLDVPMNVMNKPGGGNTIAWTYLNQHASDGHYLMMANLNLSVGHLTGTTTFSYRDFTPVSLLYDEYVVFVVRNESPIKTGRDLLERLKKDPASLSLSFSSVAGGANHIAAGLVFKAAGIDIKKVRAVVFDSAGKAITAALGGHVDFVSASASSAVSHLKAGTVRVIGITSPKRIGGVFADVPTFREQGANTTFSNYRGLIAGKTIPANQLAYWEQYFANLDKDASWRAHLDKNEWEPNYTNSRDTRKYWDELDAQMRSTLDDLGLLKKGS
jgi:putative tricarboxylic transport membrane protein